MGIREQHEILYIISYGACCTAWLPSAVTNASGEPTARHILSAIVQIGLGITTAIFGMTSCQKSNLFRVRAESCHREIRENPMRQCGAHEVDTSRYQIVTSYELLRPAVIRL